MQEISDMNNNEIRMRAYQIALSFTAENYWIARETVMYREIHLLLRHKNGNKITIVATSESIKVKKNNQIIKKIPKAKTNPPRVLTHQLFPQQPQQLRTRPLVPKRRIINYRVTGAETYGLDRG